MVQRWRACTNVDDDVPDSRDGGEICDLVSMNSSSSSSKDGEVLHTGP
jgi:hypothetical protein